MLDSRTTRPGPVGALLTFTLLFGLTGMLAASDPTPTATPTPSPTQTPQPRTVAEAARQAQASTGGGEGTAPTRTPFVISNDNLAELAAKGTLTEVTTASHGSSHPAVNPSSTAGSDVGSAATREEESKKAYWRSRYRDQKGLVETMKKEIEALDGEIPGLWNQFYSWDDPAYRDGVIKVRLDEALARREELAKRLPEEEAKLPEIMDQARRDGALPGWFRDLK